MTTPVSSDKTLAASQDLAFRTQSRDTTQVRPELSGNTDQTQKTASSSEVDVARASHLYKTDTSAGSRGDSIQDASQARSVLAELKDKMAANPSAALGIFGNASPQQASAVLAQATV